MTRRWGTSRTEAFSDGVFAIAITLLVLEIDVPESDFDDLWRGIAHQWPAYLAYATSFLTIGSLWLAHHGMFRRLQCLDARVMKINLLLLMAVSFLPFPTRLVAEAIRDPDSERAAVIFYGLWLLVISLVLAALWGAAARNREILKPELSKEDVAAISRVVRPNVAFYAALIALAVAVPQVAAIGFLVIAVVTLVRAGAGQAPTADARAEP